MRTPLAWKNVTHNKFRAAASLAGVSFAILLIFMQLGFYDACFRSSTMVFDQFDFDIALVSPHYVHLRAAGSIPRRRLEEAKGLAGVRGVAPLYISNANWRTPQTGFQREMLVLAVDPRAARFRLPALTDHVAALEKEDTVLVDRKAQKSYGSVHVGDKVELENRTVDVVGVYDYGCGFVSDASVMVSDGTLRHLIPSTNLGVVSIGFVKLAAGADRTAVINALRAKMPDDVQVLPREALEKSEQSYFVDKKPLGIMFSSGVILAFAVGAVILYQVLASEVMSRLKEYATLKAIGYSNMFMNIVVLEQATIYALLGFVPATILSLILYAMTRYSTNLPMVMTVERVLLVLGLSVVMCAVSGMLASRKVSRADPADLF
jgi:putative ABC transport system permease protein